VTTIYFSGGFPPIPEAIAAGMFMGGIGGAAIGYLLSNLISPFLHDKIIALKNYVMKK
jgi:hypothetical protein